MLKPEELEVIMKRNNKEWLYCKHISDIYCNDTIYTINIFDIPRDPKKYLYVYQVNGCKCLKVTIENSYLYINRNSEDDITEFLILIGEQKDLDKFTISQYSEIQIITDLIDYFDDYKNMEKWIINLILFFHKKYYQINLNQKYIHWVGYVKLLIC